MQRIRPTFIEEQEVGRPLRAFNLKDVLDLKQHIDNVLGSSQPPGPTTGCAFMLDVVEDAKPPAFSIKADVTYEAPPGAPDHINVAAIVKTEAEDGGVHDHIP